MLILASFILQIVVLVIVPAWFMIWLVFFESSSKVAFYAKALLTGVFIAFLFMTGRWDIVGIWFRYLWIGVFFAFAWAQFRHRDVCFSPN